LLKSLQLNIFPTTIVDNNATGDDRDGGSPNSHDNADFGFDQAAPLCPAD